MSGLDLLSERTKSVWKWRKHLNKRILEYEVGFTGEGATDAECALLRSRGILPLNRFESWLFGPTIPELCLVKKIQYQNREGSPSDITDSREETEEGSEEWPGGEAFVGH